MSVEGEEGCCLHWVPEREIKPSWREICHLFPRKDGGTAGSSPRYPQHGPQPPLVLIFLLFTAFPSSKL